MSVDVFDPIDLTRARRWLDGPVEAGDADDVVAFRRKAWVSAELWSAWVKLIFGPYVAKLRRVCPGRYDQVTLQLDGAAVHCDWPLVRQLREINVDVLILCPGSTPVLQVRVARTWAAPVRKRAVLRSSASCLLLHLWDGSSLVTSGSGR